MEVIHEVSVCGLVLLIVRGGVQGMRRAMRKVRIVAVLGHVSGLHVSDAVDILKKKLTFIKKIIFIFK